MSGNNRLIERRILATAVRMARYESAGTDDLFRQALGHLLADARLLAGISPTSAASEPPTGYSDGVALLDVALLRAAPREADK